MRDERAKPLVDLFRFEDRVSPTTAESPDRMTLYRFCNLTVACDESLPLPEVGADASDDRVVDVRLQRVAQEELSSHSSEWIHQWREKDGSVSLAVGKQGSSYLLEHPEVAVVEVSQDGESLRYAPHPDAPRAYVLTALLNQTLPRVLALQGNLALHASAVVCNGQLLIFAGESGAGKTTMAGGLTDLGLEVVADDCVLLSETEDESVLGVPSYPGLDATKPGGTQNAPGLVPVGAVYQLHGQPEEECPDPKVRSLSTRETMMLLTRGMFVLDPSSEEQLRLLFDQASRIGSHLEAYELLFPWSESQIPRLLDTVLAHAENTQTARAAIKAASKGAPG